jgi:hypothetical protein
LVSWRQLLILSLTCSLSGSGTFALAQAETIAAAASPGTKLPAPRKKPQYIMEEPKTDTSNVQPSEQERTRLNRPGVPGQSPDQSVPVAPDFNKPASTSVPTPSPVPMPAVENPPPIRPRDKFPTVGQLESLMFGKANPSTAVDARLEHLESAVFQKRFPDLDTETRIKRLKEVLMGDTEQRVQQTATSPPGGFAPGGGGYPPQGAYSSPPGSYGRGTTPTQPQTGGGYSRNYTPMQEEPQRAFFPNYEHLNLTQELEIPQLEKFALDVINQARAGCAVTYLNLPAALRITLLLFAFSSYWFLI